MKKVIEGVVTSRFGGRHHPLEGVFKVHQGIDVSAVVGTPIYSPTDGTVAAVFTHISGGLTLVLRSDCGLIRYGMCHLNTVPLEEGDEVRKGEIVAYSGNSGRSTGPHLHYSVKTGGKWYGEQYVGGSYVDSEKYLVIEP